MLTARTVFSRGMTREETKIGDRSALMRSGLLLGLMALVYVVTYYVLAGRTSANLEIYVVRPLLWGAFGVVALLMRRQLADAPGTSRLLVGLAVLAAAFQVSAILCTGVLFGFGHSPYSRQVFHVAENFWYVSALIFGIEMSRAYFLAAWSRYNAGLAFVAVSLLAAAAMLGPGQYQHLAGNGQAINRVSHIYMPGLSESLLATFLASIGGPVPALAYH